MQSKASHPDIWPQCLQSESLSYTGVKGEENWESKNLSDNLKFYREGGVKSDHFYSTLYRKLWPIQQGKKRSQVHPNSKEI